MRARVIVTDGARSADVYWVEHTGADVYHGLPGGEWKMSYHASGQTHMQKAGMITDRVRSVPLKDIKDEVGLMSVNIGLPRHFFDSRPYKTPPWKKLDTAILIDLRSVPGDQHVNVVIGLLEPWNLRAISLAMPQWPVESGIRSQQLVISTAVKPWVYAVVLWSKAPERHRGSSPERPGSLSTVD